MASRSKMPKELRPYYNEAYGDGKPADEVTVGPVKQETKAEEVEQEDNQEQEQEVQEVVENVSEQTNQPEKPTGEESQPEVQPQKPDEFQQKYQVLKGKYDAEVPRLQRKSSEQQRKIDQLEKMVGLLEDRIAMEKEPEEEATQLPPPSPHRESATTTFSSSDQLITPEDIENFGEPLVRFVQKVAGGVASNVVTNEINTHLKPISDEIGSLRGGLAKSAEERFYSELYILAPMVDSLNEDDGFNNWLDQPNDELSGYTRRDFLDNALKQLDAKKTAKFFNAYTELINEANRITEPVQQPITSPIQPTSSILESVEPVRSRGGGAETNPPPRQKQYTINDLNELDMLVKDRKISQSEFDKRYKEIVGHLKLK